MRTLRLTDDDLSALRIALRRGMNEAEADAALWFNPLVRGDGWMMRDALDRLRAFHDLRVRLSRPPSRARTRRTH